MNTAETKRYFRPLPDRVAHPGGRRIGANGPWFSQIQVLGREGSGPILPIEAVLGLFPEAEAVLKTITNPRSSHFSGSAKWPLVMGIVNVTPDSFSDGGRLLTASDAVEHGLALAEQGADILDVGGESTRPGAEYVSSSDEMDRVIPVIEGLISAKCPVPISIDTRKASVARAAISAGARLFNDVSALTHDENSTVVARLAASVCLMHAQGTPETMQANPVYENVVLDVYDFLEDRVKHAVSAGISRDRIIIDPGIGFGKTLQHNLEVLRHLSLFQSLGCAVMLGVSRKGFIGTLSGEKQAAKRSWGSIAAGLAGLDQGVQILRVHDVEQTVQAVSVWKGVSGEDA
ncbi:MAG: dihydropteroate synthase [Pseudomonadota bacterium]